MLVLQGICKYCGVMEPKIWGFVYCKVGWQIKHDQTQFLNFFIRVDEKKYPS